jgi:hypothetical protein
LLLEKRVQKRTRELSIAKERAEESDRLKTAFLQNISHEIRTPLNAVSGFSQMLNQVDLPKEKRERFVSIIQSSSKQLLSIVTDILIISALETKQEKVSKGPVPLNKILDDLTNDFQDQAMKKNIVLYTRKELSDEQSQIYTDKNKLLKILESLLSNALKFCHEGSVELGYRLKGNELEFHVKDTGIGIQPEQKEKIFERFQQADYSISKKYGGTGLGLSIAKDFVKLLEGKIWVDSHPGKGSVFYFTIPYGVKGAMEPICQ